jgi:hypothetical protein
MINGIVWSEIWIVWNEIWIVWNEIWGVKIKGLKCRTPSNFVEIYKTTPVYVEKVASSLRTHNHSTKYYLYTTYICTTHPLTLRLCVKQCRKMSKKLFSSHFFHYFLTFFLLFLTFPHIPSHNVEIQHIPSHNRR